MIIVGFPPQGPVGCVAIGSYPVNGTRYKIHVVEQSLNSNRKWLLTPVMLVPQLLSVNVS